MHRKRASDDPKTDRSLVHRRKKEIIVGNVKINKRALQPTSKSEKSSPAAVRSYKIRDSSSSRNSLNLSSPRVTQETPRERPSPRNAKLLKLQNLTKLKKSVQEHSGLLFRQSPARVSPKTTFLRSKNSESSLIKSNPSLHHKKIHQKEKAELIELISKHFVENLTEPPTTLCFYSISRLLGQGSFGKVMLGIHILTGRKVAIKVMDKSYLQNEHSRRKIFREVYILKKIRSNYVVKILEVFESDENFLIVMEYISGGDLLNYLKTNGRMTEDMGKRLFYQIILGASTIHRHGILHRDFKLDNILINKSMTKVKICDFGVSKIMHKGEIIMDQCGTPAYLAPEIVLDKGYEGFWSDIWSLGVLLYCMICGTVPFKANTLSELHKAILLGRYELPDFISNEAKDLIKKMLMVVPCKRLPLESVINHPWFNKCHEEFTEVSIDEETLRLNQEAVRVIESFGYPRMFIMNSLEYRSLNHPYAAYQLLNPK